MYDILRTLVWLVAVGYSQVPTFWFLAHPLAERWRKSDRSPYLVLVPVWLAAMLAVAAITWPWHLVTIYDTPWSWLPAGAPFAGAFWLYQAAHRGFTHAQLVGRDELEPGREPRLVTSGIRNRLRHPVYAGHLLNLLGMAVGSGLAVVYGLFAFAAIGLLIVIRLEDAELERRFGEPYREYRASVPALIPVELRDSLRLRHVLIFATAVLLVFTWIKPALNDNVESRLAFADSLVERHTTQIDASNFSRTIDKVRIDGHYYSEKPPLLSLLVAGVYLPIRIAGYTLWESRFAYFAVVFVLLGGSFIVCLACFHDAVRRFGLRESTAAWMTAMLALGTLCLPFNTTLNNHSFAASWLFIGMYCLLRALDDARLLWMRLAGCALALALGADYSIALFIAGFGLYVLLEPALRKRLLAVAVPCAAVLAASLLYNYSISGSWRFVQVRPELFNYPGSVFVQGGQELTGIHRNSVGFAAIYGWEMLFGWNGFLLYSPLLLLAIAAAIESAVRRRRLWKLAVAVLASSAAFVGFYSLYSANFSGCSYSIRWFVAFIPILWFFAFPLFLEQKKWVRIALVSAFAVSVPIAFLGYVDPWTCGFPAVFENVRQRWRLDALLPIYIPVVTVAIYYAYSILRAPRPVTDEPTPVPIGTDNRARAWLVGILLLAFALRLGVAIALPTSDYPDEIFQTREQAHRLVYGYGLIPWEFREGIRSWVFPGLLSLVVRSTAWMGHGSNGYSLGIDLALCALSLLVVWIAFRWGYRAGGLLAAIVTGLACAVWYELIYYAPQALTEVVAAYLLLPGLYFGYFADDGAPDPVTRPNARDLVLSGLFLGLAIAFRIQLAPAALVAMIWICGSNWRKWVAISGGIVASLLCFGVIDALTWGFPFASYWNSITVNVLHHKSNIYGKEPLGWYFERIGTRMGAAALLLAVLGARRSWFLTSIATTILLTHMAFPHKEYRFIFPMIPILCILIGLGLSSPAWEPFAGFSRGRALAAVAVIALISAAWAARNDVWHRNAGQILAFREMSTRSDVCGVGIPQWIFLSGGYFYLHQQVPIYLIAEEFPHDYDNFNYLVSPEGYESSYPASYRVQACRSGYCLYERPGSCAAPPRGYSINRLLQQLNM